MVWNVFRYNSNKHVVEEFNVSTHFDFAVAVDKLKKECKTKVDFAIELERKLLYYFWSKYEYEICVSGLFSYREGLEQKIDIYSQIMMNYDIFVDYIWGNKT